MKENRARFTVILVTALFMVASCADSNRPDQRNADPQPTNPQPINPTPTDTQIDESAVEHEDECHDPDCSPVAGGGMILFSDGDCRLQAVDAKTGKRKWLFAKERGGDYVPVVSEGTAYVAAEKRMYALDVETGRVRWKRDFRGYLYSTKIVGDLLFTTSDKSVYAVIARTGEIVWQYKAEVEYVAIYHIDDKRVYVSIEGDIYAIDISTGKPAWRFDTEGRSPVELTASQGMVCMGLDDGTIIGLDGETGKESWSLKTKFDTASVKADDSSVYFGNWLRLQAVDIRTGEVKWLSEKGYNRVGHINTVADGEIYFEDSDFIYAVNALTGQESWRYQRKAWRFSSVVVADRKIYFTDGGYFYTVDAPTKNHLWKIKLEYNEVYTDPVVTGGAVCFIEGCDLLSAVDVKTGKRRWRFTS